MGSWFRRVWRRKIGICDALPSVMSFTTSFAPFKPKSRLQGCEPILTLWSQLTYPLRNFNKHCCHVVIFCLLLLRKNVRNKPPPNPVRLPLIGPWSKVYLSQVFLLSFFDNVGGACKIRTSEGRSAVRVSPYRFATRDEWGRARIKLSQECFLLFYSTRKFSHSTRHLKRKTVYEEFPAI